MSDTPNFFEQIRANHRRSMVLMSLTFVVLWAFVNVIALALGGHSRDAACSYDSSYSCGTEFFWNPATLALTASALLALGVPVSNSWLITQGLVLSLPAAGSRQSTAA